MIVCRTRGVDQTRALAAAVARLCRPRDVIVLAGDMGAGKTAFAAGFAAALGVTEEDQVSSPTFTLVHTYATGRVPVHHADLYRLSSIGEVADLGLREMADLGGIVLVEWGDVALEVLGECLVIRLAHETDGSDADTDVGDIDVRHIEVSVEGHSWDSRWQSLRGALAEWGSR